MAHLGEKWIVREPFKVRYLIHWKAPFTDGGECEVPQGVVVEIIHEPPLQASAALCRPINYEEVEAIVIPDGVRQTPKYDGFTFSIPLEQFGNVLTREP